MSISNPKNSLQQQVVPKFFMSKAYHIQPFAPLPQMKDFDLFRVNFGSLATQDIIDSLHPYLLEIDLKNEFELMQEGSALEITIPFLGIADFLQSFNLDKFSCQFAHILGLNGFTAKNHNQVNDNYPKADFVVATDIVGNKFEVIINQDGKIELPQEGIGLFSIISSLTFIYDNDRVKKGYGWQKTRKDADKNKVIILPASKVSESYVITICVTHLNSRYQRVVDSIRSILIRHQPLMLNEINHQEQIKRFDEDSPDMLSMNIRLKKPREYSAKLPFAINVTLQPLKGVEYHFIQPLDSLKSVSTNYYVKHPVFSNVYTKYVGLSERGFSSLLNKIYTEYDLIKNYVHHENLTFSHANGYNNFLLRPEAFVAFYDLLIHCLVNQMVPGEFLFKRISEERLGELELSDLNLDFHDTMVIWQLKEDFLQHRFEKFRNLFTANHHEQWEMVEDNFQIYAKGLSNNLPKVTLEILNQQNFTKNILSYVDRAAFEEHFQEVTAKALQQSSLNPFEIEKISKANKANEPSNENTLLGMTCYQTLHLNEVVDFSSLMVPQTRPDSAYWVDLAKPEENKVYAFYVKTILEQKNNLQMNVTQAKKNKTYQITTWVENSAQGNIQPGGIAKPD